MDFLDCARCGRHVTSEAPRCPECGADPRSGIATFKRGEMDRVRICQGVWIRCLALVIDVVVVGAVTLLTSLLVYLVLLGRGDGAKLGTGGPCVRNLLRIADWLPFFYVLAAAAIWAAPSNQRIGDVAARSVVVRTKLVSVSRLDDATLSVVSWWALTSSRRAPSPRRP